MESACSNSSSRGALSKNNQLLCAPDAGRRAGALQLGVAGQRQQHALPRQAVVNERLQPLVASGILWQATGTWY